MFTNIIDSISNIKNQYFPNNQIEKELSEILFNSNTFPNQIELKKIANYSNDTTNLVIIKKYILNYFNFTTHYNVLHNLLNLIEYLIFNGNFDFVITCKINYKEKLTELSKDYIYLDNGIDKGFLIRNKTSNILWLLENNEYLLSEREKIKNIVLTSESNYKCCKCLRCECDNNKINKNCYCKNKDNIENTNDKKYDIKIKPLEEKKNEINKITPIKKIIPKSNINLTNPDNLIDLIGLNDFNEN
jgi:hypothetical protein